MRENLKRWLILLPVLAGVGTLVFLMKNRDDPQQAPLTEQARPVRFIQVPSVAVVPRALGYGNVEPGKTWEAVAEVSGKLDYINPRLKRGAIMKAGEVLLRIDPADYQLAVAQSEANIQATEAQLAELDVKDANTRTSITIEEEVLKLGEQELERKRKLADRGTVTRSELDAEQRNMLALRQGVQNLNNTLNLIPAERTLLQAQLARDQTQLQTAQLDLDRTTITLPLTGRIAQVEVEQSEYVRQGDVLAQIDSIDVAEIPAQVPMGRVGALIRSNELLKTVPANLDMLRRVLGLSARVWLRDKGLTVMWEGRVARFSDTIDPQTRTLGVIVEVDDPYKDVQPGVRPPLLKGLFVEVELRGRARAEQLVIPRSALHGAQVYTVTEDDRLRKRPVQVSLVQPEFIAIGSGLEAGERVVISDLIPAIDGMLLQPLVDEEVLERLLREAEGEDALP